MKRTFVPKKEDVKQKWHLIDADSKVLGRVASEISTLLTGKNKPAYTPHINTGDKVVVINADKITVTGNKMKNKIYKRTTGYPGGVKQESLDKLLKREPTEVIKKAVYGMLPKNKLRGERIKNLYIYQGSEHPHKAQLK